MKLDPVAKAPPWFKRHPKTGIYYVEEHRAECYPKRICRSTGEAQSKERALRLADDIRRAWQAVQDPKLDAQITMRELCFRVLESQEAKHRRGKIRIGTLQNSRIYLPKIADEFGHLTPDRMTVGVWESFCTRYHTENPKKLLINHWSFLGMVMEYAFNNGLSPRKWKVENPDPKRKAGRALTDAEIQSIFEAASQDLKDQMLFAVTMGMRKREHLHLSWDQVDLSERTVTVLESGNKNKKQRTIRMSPQVHEMLRRRWSVTKGYVFPSPDNKSVPSDDNKTAWAAAKRRAKIIGRCRYHDLRHTFVTQCAKMVRDKTVSITLICAYIDMSIRVFEKVYLHLNHQDTAAVADLVAVKVR
jgi:integrase